MPSSIRVLMPNGQVAEMKLETYLAGVVAAEIGAHAPLEALKAQAVAARTYAAAAHRHAAEGADVCTGPHCQEWKRVDPIVAPGIFQALSETWGIVAIHDGKFIDAFYFEHCDGRTRSSEEVHISPVAYLRGVECACGFVALKGHGVGMCQRGAIVMARRGASFEQILQHYYRGIVVIHSGRPTVQEITAPEPPKPARKSRATSKRAKAKPVELAEQVSPAPPLAEPKQEPAPVAEITAPEIAAPPVEPAPVAETPELVESPQLETPAAPVIAQEPVAEIPAVEVEAIPEESPVQVEQAPAEPVQEPISVPSYVEQLNNPTPTPAPIVPPVETKITPILEHELPTLDEQIAVKKPRVHIDHLPGQRMIAGCLPSAGVVVSIEDAKKNKTLVFSGSAPHYGEGGFETIVGEDGRYVVAIDGERVEVKVEGDTVFISWCGS
ncbi:MAG: SpoIID/LytB domain-containing protein [Chloroflexi bacterium]|nr:SpoIID/LytB domain-containing protein [Chloroflexota bacterium]